MKTPQEKLEDKQRQNLKALLNRVAGEWSFRKIKVWQDVYNFTGRPPNVTDEITQSQVQSYQALKDYFATLTSELEERIKKSREVPVASAPIAEQPATPQVEIGTDHDYGLHSSPKEKAFLFWFQKKAVKELWDGITKHNKRGQLLLSGTGTGKTFMVGALIRRLVDAKFTEGKTFGPTQYLCVTRATIVEQTKRVFKEHFNLDIKDGVEILNIEQLRCRAGEFWIKEECIIEHGEEKTVYIWKKHLNPVVIIWDESQSLKNEGTVQHNIAVSFNDIPQDTYQVFVSATPFTRVIEAKCFCVSTRKVISDNIGLGRDIHINNQTWPTYACAIAAPSDPIEYVEAAVERLVRDLDDYIVRVRGVRPQFDAVNSIQMIHFTSDEERRYYENAYDRYLQEKAKLEKQQAGDGDGGASKFQILVQFLKFRMAAEYCRRYHLAKAMYESVTKGNQAAVAALNFKGSIIAIVKILVNEFGVPRDQISLVWGGGQTQLTKKQKAKAKVKEAASKLEAIGEDLDSLLQDLNLDEVEDRVLEELDSSLRLGNQTRDERQREIDKFQSGRSLYCLYTFRAGGVGLSLHHSDEHTKLKVPRKANGYAVTDEFEPYTKDNIHYAPISKIPVRQRINFVAPTYSAIELVQGLGRCPRLTSLSDTPQTLVFYAGTIEVDVANIVSAKLRCLSKVVRQRESWADMIVGGVRAEEHINNTKDLVDTEHDKELAMAGSESEEE